MFGLGRMTFIAVVGHCSVNGPVTFTWENRMAGPLWFICETPSRHTGAIEGEGQHVTGF